jgi:hypothetical protein
LVEKCASSKIMVNIQVIYTAKKCIFDAVMVALGVEQRHGKYVEMR